MKGLPNLRLMGAMAFVAAAFSAMAEKYEQNQAALKSGAALLYEPSSGAFLHRGGPGTRAYKRAALKKRNQARHRKACKG